MQIGRMNRRTRLGSQAGLTMIELLMAGVVLVVGMLGGMVLITTAIASNTRSKIDSTATMVAEAVLDQLKATAGTGTGTATLTDCANNSHTIDTSSGGAALRNNGDIDFSEASPPTGFHMDYSVCIGNVRTTYDVRWRLDVLTANGSTGQGTYQVTVGAHMKNTGTATTTNLAFFALPVTLRALIQTPV
jgi:type II secretory pathway pseudopilin PulG